MADKIKDVTIRFKTETDEIRKADTQFDQLNKKVGDFEKKGTQAATNVGNSFRSIAGAFGLVTTIDAAVSSLVSFGKEAVALAAKGEGVRTAFAKSFGNVEENLEKLRKATRGAVSDIDLMSRALQAKNFGIGAETLAKGLEFAGKVARQTGQDVNYLADSIVTGIGRKSPLILDNLGISAVELQKEVKRLGGDFEQAVGNIINKRLVEMGDVAETSADKIAKMKASFANLQEQIGAGLIKTLVDVKEALIFRFGSEEEKAAIKRNESLSEQEKRVENFTKAYTKLTNEQLEAQKKYAQGLLEVEKAELSIAGNNKARQSEVTKRQLLTLAEIEAIDNLIKKRKESATITKELTEEEIKAMEKALEEERKHRNDLRNKDIADQKEFAEKLVKLQLEALKLSNERAVLEAEEGSEEELQIKIKGLEKIRDFRIENEVEAQQDEINIRTETENQILELRRKYDDKWFDEKAKNDEEEYKKQQKAKTDHEKLMAEIAKNRIDAEFQLASDFASALATINSYAYDEDLRQLNDLLENKQISQDEFEREERELRRKAAGREKLLSIFQIGIKTAEGIVNYLSNPATAPIVPFFIAQSAIQAALVAAKPLPFAKGVIDLQEGSGTKDDVHAVLMRGESVMTKDETREHKGLLQAIRRDYFEEYIQKNYVNPAIENLIHYPSMAENLSRSIELNIDEHKLSRIMRRNKSVVVENMPSSGIGESEWRLRERRGLNG